MDGVLSGCSLPLDWIFKGLKALDVVCLKSCKVETNHMNGVQPSHPCFFRTNHLFSPACFPTFGVKLFWVI
jgi:hypothetical protein